MICYLMWCPGATVLFITLNLIPKIHVGNQGISVRILDLETKRLAQRRIRKQGGEHNKILFHFYMITR